MTLVRYRALRLASRGIVGLQRHAGRRHVNRALTQLSEVGWLVSWLVGWLVGYVRWFVDVVGRLVRLFVVVVRLFSLVVFGCFIHSALTHSLTN